MDLVYSDGRGKNVAVFYENASANGLLHNIRLEDGNLLDVHDNNLQLIHQPDFQIFPQLFSIIETKL